MSVLFECFFFFQAEDGIRDGRVTGVQTCALPIFESLYDRLRTVEPAPATFIPLFWGNGMKGDVHGVEIWGNWQAADWWRLSAGFKIGRASCRERVEMSVVAAALTRNKTGRSNETR